MGVEAVSANIEDIKSVEDIVTEEVSDPIEKLKPYSVDETVTRSEEAKNTEVGVASASTKDEYVEDDEKSPENSNKKRRKKKKKGGKEKTSEIEDNVPGNIEDSKENLEPE